MCNFLNRDQKEKGLIIKTLWERKMLFGFPDKWQIKIAFLQISQVYFHDAMTD